MMGGNTTATPRPSQTARLLLLRLRLVEASDE